MRKRTAATDVIEEEEDHEQTTLTLSLAPHAAVKRNSTSSVSFD